MKKTILALILMLSFSASYSQTDTCQIDSTVRVLYYNDAVNMTLDSIASNPLHPYYDSIHLPYTMVNRILRDFSRVYALNSAERDTVVDLLNIHCLWNNPATFPKVRNSVIIGVDTNYAWINQFIIDSIYSGNASFDSLVAGNAFKLVYYSSYFKRVTIRTDSSYNLRPLTEALMNIPGVLWANEAIPPAFSSEPINYVNYNLKPSYDELIFTHAWDCFDNCDKRRSWKFHVYPDCSASFVSSWGNSPPAIPGNVVNGYLRYDNASLTPMGNCQVKLIRGNDTLVQTTNSSGFFEFTNVQNGNYQLKVSSNKPWGGVNSADAMKVLQHFTGFSFLSPFRKLAAEVNGNSVINASAALTILKRVVGLTNSFVTGDWLFESTVFSVSGQSITNINLKGICYGDTDGSYTPNP